MLLKPESLPGKPFQPVSNDSITGPLTDRGSKTRVGKLVWCGINSHQAITATALISQYKPELGITDQSMLFSKE